MNNKLKNINRGRVLKLFKDFGYRVIKLKYFIMIVGAMLLEIVTLILYIFNNERVIEFDLMTASMLYGVTSLIIIILAVSTLILIKTDKNRDKKRISQFNDFRREYFKINNEYSGEINNLVRHFDSERGNIEAKINYAIEIAEKYDEYIKKFSRLEVPAFLRDAHNYKMENLSKEKLFFTKFSMLTEPEELGKINKESDRANENFLRELGNVEKNLKIIV